MLKAELEALIAGAAFEVNPRMEERYALYVEKFSTGVQGAILRYAQVLAMLVQARMARGQKLADVVEQSAKEAAAMVDLEYSSARHLAVIHVLVVYWRHGETLRLWHNVANGHPSDMPGIGIVTRAAPAAAVAD